MQDISLPQYRRLFIRMARKRQRPGSGSSFAFLRERTQRMQFPNLREILPSSTWAIIGTAATRLYMPERTTNDLDILIYKDNSLSVRAALTSPYPSPCKEEGTGSREFIYTQEFSMGGSSWKTAQDFPIDIIESEAVWCQQAIAEAQSNRDGDNNPVLPLPYLVLMKFEASRSQDIADITRILGQAMPNQLGDVRRLFQNYLPQEGEDLESLILPEQMEMR